MAWLVRLLGHWGLWLAGAVGVVIVVAAKQIWDGILGVGDWALQLVPASLANQIPTVAQLQPDVLCLLDLMGFFKAAALIGSAIVVRIPLSFVFRR